MAADVSTISYEPGKTTQEQQVFHRSQFFLNEPPQLQEDSRELLEKYSGIPSDQVVSHVMEIRDKGWKVHQYPCIGLYRFINLALSHHPLYQSIVLPRLKDSSPPQTLLDLGTCMGQDVRKLVYDGVPPSQLIGCDILPEFIDIGYELFKDKDKLAAKFLAPADLFDPDNAVFKELEGKIDILHVNAVFHLFSYRDQKLIAKRMIKLLKPTSGSLILGAQNANEKPGEYPQRPGDRDNTLYRHNAETWRKMWEEVSEETGTAYKADATISDIQRPPGTHWLNKGQWADPHFKWMTFEVWRS